MKREIQCSVLKDLRLEKAVNNDYQWLYPYHYRACGSGPVAGVWVLKHTSKGNDFSGNLPVGAIVYGMPSANLAARTLFADLKIPPCGRRENLCEINRRLRVIRRVIIDPRYRGLGLAARLVRQTLPRVGTQAVEAYTVMGSICRFFESAGMRAFFPPERRETVDLRAALCGLGITEELWWDSRAVWRQLEALDRGSKLSLEKRMTDFLKAYKNRRSMPDGEERIRFILSRLQGRPVYYLWKDHRAGDARQIAA